jgi:hypothetical protein
MGLLLLVLALLFGRVEAVPSGTVSSSAVPSSAVPSCTAGGLAVTQTSAGGPAAGTVYTPVTVRNLGADCALRDGGLVAATPHGDVALDLDDEVVLAAGQHLDLFVSVPDGRCAVETRGPRWPLALRDAAGAAVPVSGPGLSPAYGCRGLRLTSAGRPAAPSR